MLWTPLPMGDPTPERVGVRTHFWGGVTNFNAWNGKIGDGMADLSVAYLKQYKWNASRKNGTASSVSVAPLMPP